MPAEWPMRSEGRRVDDLAHLVAVARGAAAPDLVVSGARVLSVFTGELVEADVAVAAGRIAGVGRYDGPEVFDASGMILLPGFIDGHMHLESTKLMVDQFARAVLPHGTTTVVIDPHEIANVFGVRGVRALLAAAKDVPLDYVVMAPSCVPASEFESNGATVGAADIAALLDAEPAVHGVAEMMAYPSVIAGDEDVLSKILAAGGRRVDGHAPRLSGRDLNAYLAAGVESDHECTTYAEALEKRRLGMWIMIREGSAARNLKDLLPLVMEFGPGNCLLCTDDREPNELLRDGHINAVMRTAVGLGCPPYHAIVMGTLFAARYHRLYRHGAVAPGYVADVVAVPDLTSFRPRAVWKRGRLAAAGGRAVGVPKVPVPDWMRGSIRIDPVDAGTFAVRADGRVRVIGVEPGTLVTRALTAEPERRDGLALADPSQDLAKIAVIERHRRTGRRSVGFVRGFGLRRGALASTQAHDAHNVVVVGIDERDMAAAVNRLIEVGGGQVAVADGRVAAEVPCPIGGLLSDRPVEEVAAGVEAMEAAARELGCTLPAPFMSMSFLALSVIPELKITDRGLVDTTRFEVVPLEV
jgi:adenine deaminase